MKIPFSPEDLRRYRDVAMLLVRYGRSDLVRQAGLDAALDGTEAPEEGVAEATELASDLERMGPTFVKLGQMLSTRVDLLPAAYLEPLTRLQDSVEPFAYDEVRRIVEQELEVRISKAFSHFDEEPMASASLGQVHRAALRDGRPVAIKVQRPGIRDQVRGDLETLAELAEFFDRHTDAGRRYGFGPMVEEFRRALLTELDYRREASNLRAMHRSQEPFDRILVPAPIEDYTSSRVLTMEYVRGVKVDDLSPVARLDIEGSELAEELFRSYLRQILVDGLFHADPHPGNVFLTADRRLALLDLGMVGRIPEPMQNDLVELLMAIGESDAEGTASVALRLGETLEDHDEQRFRRDIRDLVAEHRDAVLEDLQVGKIVLRVFGAAAHSGLRIPPELSVLGKALLQLDKIGRALDPKFDPNAAIRRNVGSIMQSRLAGETSWRRLFSALTQAREFAEELPGRVNRVLDAVANNDFEVKVDAIDEQVLIVGFQKIANRITAGLVLAALIVGAALLMRIETKFTIFGYPGLAMLCFLAAAGGGFWLVWTILWGDQSNRET